MPSASRLGDTGSGHESWPATNVIEASSDVITEGVGQARVGDALASHGSPSPSPVHGRTIAAGSSTVIVNGRKAVRIGDAVACGGLLVSGASTVNIGG